MGSNELSMRKILCCMGWHVDTYGTSGAREAHHLREWKCGICRSGVYRMPREEETMRIQLDLPEERIQELRALMEAADIETYKELFNNALTLLEWSVAESQAGRTLASMDDTKEGYRVLVMPMLQRVAKKARHTQVATP